MFLKRKVVIPLDYYSKWNWHTGSTWTSTAQRIQSFELAVSKNLQPKISFTLWKLFHHLLLFCAEVEYIVALSAILNKKALLSQRWPRDAPYVYLQAIHPNFVHAYGHYTMRGFWFWMNLSSGNFVYFCKTDVSAVQGHPRSLILVPLESAYATSY